MSVMLRDEPLLKPLLESPRLFFFQSKINEVLSAEQKKREAFYEWMDEDTRAEFINGEIIMHSPAKYRHTRTAARLFGLLNTYVLNEQLGVALFETVLISLTRNDYLPDRYLLFYTIKGRLFCGRSDEIF